MSYIKTRPTIQLSESVRHNIANGAYENFSVETVSFDIRMDYPCSHETYFRNILGWVDEEDEDSVQVMDPDALYRDLDKFNNYSEWTDFDNISDAIAAAEEDGFFARFDPRHSLYFRFSVVWANGDEVDGFIGTTCLPIYIIEPEEGRPVLHAVCPDDSIITAE